MMRALDAIPFYAAMLVLAVAATAGAADGQSPREAPFLVACIGTAPDDAGNESVIQFVKSCGIEAIAVESDNFKEDSRRKSVLVACRKAGVKVIVGWAPWRTFWDKPQDQIDADIRKWTAETFKDDFDLIDEIEVDEPTWGLGDFERWEKGLLENFDDPGLQELLRKELGVAGSPAELKQKGKLRAALQLRHRLFAQRLDKVLRSYRNVTGKNTSVIVSPFSYESGPGVGTDMNLCQQWAEHSSVATDPYFQAFRRPLQFSGFFLRWFRNGLGGKPLAGVMQFYDAREDAGRNPDGWMNQRPQDVYRQPFEFLMNGSTGVWVFIVNEVTLRREKNKTALRDALSFIRANEALYRDKRPVADVAIYFSENTFRMLDLFPPWSRMTSGFGPYFQVEQTYYTLSAAHIPADVVSVSFGDETKLADRLAKYKVVILPDVVLMSDHEAECFRDFVANGGTLIATGRTGSRDEDNQPRAELALAKVLGVSSGASRDRRCIRIVGEHSFLPSFHNGEQVPTQGSPENLFREKTYRYPASFRDFCQSIELKAYELWGDSKLGRPQGGSWLPHDGARTIARYEDGEPAITLHRFGKGAAIAVAPSDITLFPGSIGNKLDEPQGVSRRTLELTSELIRFGTQQSALVQLDRCPADIEVSVTEDDRSRLVHLLNHGDNPAKEGMTCHLSLPEGKQAARLQIITADGVSGRADFEVEKEVPNSRRIQFKLPGFQYYAAAIVTFETR